MFAYCNNNPIILVDYSGDFPGILLGIVTLVVTALVFTSCGSNNYSDEDNEIINIPEVGYDSIDEAAIAASHDIEKRMKQTGVEYGVNIYTYPYYGDKYYYDIEAAYTNNQQTSVKPRYRRLPDGAVLVAWLHIHPWSNEVFFSEADRKIAAPNWEIPQYLAVHDRDTNQLIGVYRFNRDKPDEPDQIWP